MVRISRPVSRPEARDKYEQLNITTVSERPGYNQLSPVKSNRLLLSQLKKDATEGEEYLSPNISFYNDRIVTLHTYRRTVYAKTR
jgi:hypothetical protein|uniref:Uncharacterized protein n=1 Tax=Picea glauca TaxID=3330 RepID=A0A101LZK1_PICGL|nr:hypothetical protein ABT39_MTgene5234 [Picea glauca]QHR89166.1 hypothetical protein Q903MT_gene3186 [Picea sitchensis]